jgi:octaprenyl-diphosphate synthase
MWHGTDKQKALIKEAIETGNGMHHFTEIMAAMEQTGALIYTKERAVDASEKAIKAITPLPESDHKSALISLANIAVERAS